MKNSNPVKWRVFLWATVNCGMMRKLKFMTNEKMLNFKSHLRKLK